MRTACANDKFYNDYYLFYFRQQKQNIRNYCPHGANTIRGAQ